METRALVTLYDKLRHYCRYGQIHTLRVFLTTNPKLDINRFLKDSSLPYDGIAQTPLMIACHYGYNEMVKELLRHPDIEVNLRDSGGRTAFVRACTMEHVDVIDTLLSHEKVNVNIDPISGHTALYWLSRFEGGRGFIPRVVSRTFISCIDFPFPWHVPLVSRPRIFFQGIQQAVIIISSTTIKRIGIKCFFNMLPYDILYILCKEYLLSDFQGDYQEET